MFKTTMLVFPVTLAASVVIVWLLKEPKHQHHGAVEKDQPQLNTVDVSLG